MYQISSDLVDNWPNTSSSLTFKMAASAILENGGKLSLSHFPESAGFTKSVYQISSNSVDKWPNGNISPIFKMAAAAIL
jgi:hypothetical protein